MSAPDHTEPAVPDVAALQREIERVHEEVHILAEQVADLQRAWDTLPGWLRWLARAR
jgi:hypothetical protein